MPTERTIVGDFHLGVEPPTSLMESATTDRQPALERTLYGSMLYNPHRDSQKIVWTEKKIILRKRVNILFKERGWKRERV